MNAPVIAAIVAVVLAIVGVIGIIVPVLPGSITIVIGFLVWAIFAGSWPVWVAFGVGAALLITGMIIGWVLTGRGLKKKQVPNRSVLIGLAAGIVGLFVLPAFGLPIGFAAGLVASEYARVREFRAALDSSWTAVKALGLGMLIELMCALVATTILALSIFLHFIWL
ncbi:DUF456 domain-containing protein [Pseudoclavibacter sp. RFBA6]|uniref:DUF456 domain-containing protein n=1 Tax=Pseudoclavibacter sp. RFBA6 TaxID=2080573 RepID=UPI000CE89605|nr:DUF456 domain-containing protein [Pseudoclavibacter sp. RFBA6]PPG39215.1 DUF456 domain-containing protein [Pseudoclavibacter sp. RFBA6]